MGGGDTEKPSTSGLGGDKYSTKRPKEESDPPPKMNNIGRPKGRKIKKNTRVNINIKPAPGDTSAVISQWLMQHNKAHNDADFSRKACESLVKKLKDKRSDLEVLINAVDSDGTDANKCVPIIRTLDGRLQVAGRKGFPHVTYVRVFRWPTVHKNELKHLSICYCAYDMKHENVCVNPWHYERVAATGPPERCDSTESVQITACTVPSINRDYMVQNMANAISSPPHQQQAIQNNNNNNQHQPPPQSLVPINHTTPPREIRPDMYSPEVQRQQMMHQHQMMQQQQHHQMQMAAQQRQQHQQQQFVAQHQQPPHQQQHLSPNRPIPPQNHQMPPQNHQMPQQNHQMPPQNHQMPQQLHQVPPPHQQQQLHQQVMHGHPVPNQMPPQFNPQMPPQQYNQYQVPPPNQYHQQYPPPHPQMASQHQQYQHHPHQHQHPHQQQQFIPNHQVPYGGMKQEQFPMKQEPFPQQAYQVTPAHQQSVSPYSNTSPQLPMPYEQQVNHHGHGHVYQPQVHQHTTPPMNPGHPHQFMSPPPQVVYQRTPPHTQVKHEYDNRKRGMMTQDQVPMDTPSHSRTPANNVSPQQMQHQHFSNHSSPNLPPPASVPMNHPPMYPPANDQQAIHQSQQMMQDLTVQQQHPFVPHNDQYSIQTSQILSNQSQLDATELLDVETKIVERIQKLAKDDDERMYNFHMPPDVDISMIDEILRPFEHDLRDFPSTSSEDFFSEQFNRCFEGEVETATSLYSAKDDPEIAEEFKNLDKEQAATAKLAFDAAATGDGRLSPTKECSTRVYYTGVETKLPEGTKLMPPTSYNDMREIYTPGRRLEDQDKPMEVRLNREHPDYTKHEPSPGERQPYDNLPNLSKLDGNQMLVNMFEPEDSNVPSNWGCFVYYEKTTNVGEKQAYHNMMFIDGGLASSPSRFCMGTEINPIRDAMTEKVRSLVGRGIRLSVKADGDIWIRVFSPEPIFLNSSFLDSEALRGQNTFVHKVYPGGRLKIFDLQLARKKIRRMRLKQLLLKQFQEGKTTYMDDVFRNFTERQREKYTDLGADDFRDYCVVNVAFVKGYGPSYSKRQQVKDCESWVEIKMNDAFRYLDSLLLEDDWTKLAAA